MQEEESIISKVIPISDSEFRKISVLVYQNFGINLTESKRSLVISRLQKVLKIHKFKTFIEYINYLQTEKGKDALNELVNRISTNHTFFYREYRHFEFFEKIALPEAKTLRTKQGIRKIKLWCAAASRGDEPYTIMIHLMRFLGRDYPLWETGLLATDISEDALREAIAGIYPFERVDKIDKATLKEYFDVENGYYRVKESLRKGVMFRKFNLITNIFPFKGDFDMIFCRNVMIYFDEKTKIELTKKLYDQLRVGGYLFIGHSETLNGLGSNFKQVQSAIYQKV
ncbi:MAG: protein-glutamate O-methyltransferase CheR [Chitinispirillales bacterium]|jgi:chemotaxis protein methyltransferase CheR|nr:protein-glutamate O-methyltransferase CheR [Chitinispirillales bacterium]